MVDASFTAIIEPDEDGYHAYVPALPGCHTFGATIDEARDNLLEAAALHIEAMREHGEEIPEGADQIIVTRVTIPLAS
jgi:predicted RNase H-like HicB family nuclease